MARYAFCHGTMWSVSPARMYVGTSADARSIGVPRTVRAQMLGGTARFILVNSGHIQALVNPPDPGSRRKYRVADAVPPSPEVWLAESAEHTGSWWPDYLAWLQPRSGERKPTPKSLGSKEHKQLTKAPGTYVFET